VILYGHFGLVGVVGAAIIGNPGPLDCRGDPLSLDSLLGDKAYVVISQSYHGNMLTFSGQSIPEPSSLLMLALGIGGISVACVARFQRRAWSRRASRGLIRHG
jgi:hypothetical protein